MSTVTRNLSNIDGANVGNPDENMFAASNIPAYANDAAYEADFTAVAGSVYWNTTDKLVREYNGTAWQNDKTSFTTQTDSTTTGSSQDITPNTFDQVIRFTNGSLASIRSISPSIQKVIHFVNGQAGSIVIKNEDLTATAVNRIVTGSGNDITLAAGQVISFIYETVGARWRVSGGSFTPTVDLDWSMQTSNLSFSATVAANALTFNLLDQSGSTPSGGSPVLIGFRSSTLTNGSYNVRTVSASLSLVISSGSTLGHASSLAYPVFLYALDNAGVVELAASTTLFDTSGVISTTAEGGAGAADSVNVMYSTTARSNVPFRLIGKIISTQTTAGTWVAAPSLVTTTMLDSPASTVFGSTSGAAIPALNIGEVKTSTVSTLATYTNSNVWENITTLPITAGNWLVSANVEEAWNNSTTQSDLNVAISGYTTTTTTDHTKTLNVLSGRAAASNNENATITLSNLSVRCDGTNLYIGAFTIVGTTLYLKSKLTYSGTAGTRAGSITAVRMP